ncbi:MAG: hypothetical protein ABFR65_03495 [Pseudomonadota bacterium]
MANSNLNICANCPHELINGVACDWQPENCRYHKMTSAHERLCSRKHSAWAVNVADESEYDAVKSMG